MEDGVHEATDAEAGEAFEGGADGEGSGDAIGCEVEVGDPEEAGSEAEEEADSCGELLGAGVDHGRRYVEGVEGLTADGRQGAVVGFPEAADEEIGGEDEGDAFKWSEEEQADGGYSQKRVGAGCLFVDSDSYDTASVVHFDPLFLSIW